MILRNVSFSYKKQTKNRNETGSDLSLGERLTRLSKRLSRKRCCDTTPDHCHECSCLTISPFTSPWNDFLDFLRGGVFRDILNFFQPKWSKLNHDFLNDKGYCNKIMSFKLIIISFSFERLRWFWADLISLWKNMIFESKGVPLAFVKKSDI